MFVVSLDTNNFLGLQITHLFYNNYILKKKLKFKYLFCYKFEIFLEEENKPNISISFPVIKRKPNLKNYLCCRFTSLQDLNQFVNMFCRFSMAGVMILSYSGLNLETQTILQLEKVL